MTTHIESILVNHVNVITSHPCECGEDIEDIVIIWYPNDVKEFLEKEIYHKEIDITCDECDEFNRWTTIFLEDFEDEDIEKLKEFIKEFE